MVRKSFIWLGFIYLFSAYSNVLADVVLSSDLEFVSGKDSSGYTEKGKPLAVYSIADSLPTDILTNVYSMLPEGSSVNPDFIAQDNQTSIAIDDLNEGEFATVTVTFLNEGAGYNNVFGYFLYPTDDVPQTQSEVNHVVIFPNASKPSSGELIEGDTLDLGIQVEAGYSIGFFVIPNGWGWTGSFNRVNSGTPFYSLNHLNPEATRPNREHNVAFLDAQNEFLIIGFEDLTRPFGDNDFNDILFTVNVTPFVAIDGVNVDGTFDSSYELLAQVNQPAISTTTIYPSGNTWATIAFEDKWPSMGDYDFNDVVFRQRVTEVQNGQREVKALSVHYQLQAMGANYSNGFALNLPGVAAANLAEVSLTRNGVPVTHEIVELDTAGAILVISPNLKQDLEQQGLLGTCSQFRVTADCAAEQTAELEFMLELSFVDPVSKDILGKAPYDPFIFAVEGTFHGNFANRPGRSWETHLKGFSGTPMFDTSFFGLEDDASNSSNSFVNANSFPWVINIGSGWSHPVEGVDISDAYPDFQTWASSNGESAVDWWRFENAVSGKVVE